MEDEIKTVDQKGVWYLVDFPADRKLFSICWVYHVKTKSNEVI